MTTTVAAAPTWRVVDRVVDLARIYEDDVNVVVLERPRPAPLGAWLDALARAETSKQALAVEPGALEEGLARLVATFPAGAERDAFRDDLAWLADVYAELLGATRVGLRLNVFGEDMCPRFHADQVLVRLICTYAGPGTEFLDEADVDREGLAARDGEALRPGGVVRRAPTFAVVLLKGGAWPDNAGKGAVHRSPPVRAAGERRVLLTIDGLA